MSWKILDTGVNPAEKNMQIDTDLLKTLDPKGLPILHLYDWEGDCATYGYLTNPADFLDLKAVEAVELNLARRPTGGGIVFHAWDFAFSVLIPAESPLFSSNTLDNYALINTRVKQAVFQFLGIQGELIENDFPVSDPACKRFCMAQPTKFDLVLQGRKIAGSAQRRTKLGFLHQGTIALCLPPQEYLGKILKKASLVEEAMRKHTFPLVNKTCKPSELAEIRLRIKEILIQQMCHDNKK